MNTLIMLWNSYWPDIKEFLNSQFFTSIIGAGLATLVGAWIAQNIAIRNSQREEMLKEIRAVNSAITLVFSITNSFFSVKKQFVSNLVKEYYGSRDRFLLQLKFRKFNNQLNTKPIYVQGNFISFKIPDIPLTTLENIILAKISIRTRPLAAFNALHDAYGNLISSVQVRQGILDEYREKGFSPYEYFGVRHNSNVDKRYEHSIEGIKSYTDDGIFFSNLLCEDLQKYGDELAAKFKKMYRSEPPIISHINFKAAILEGYMPFQSEYRSWMQGFAPPAAKLGKFKSSSLKIYLYSLFFLPTVNWVFIAYGIFVFLSIVVLVNLFWRS